MKLRLIRESYLFMGYGEFSNFIAKTVEKYNSITNAVGEKMTKSCNKKRVFK